MAPDMLKILLISPKGDYLCKNSEFADYMRKSREMKTIMHYWNGSGAALQTIAGLTPGEHSITIIDENWEGIDFNEQADIVALTAMTQQASRAYEIAAEFKKRGKYVVMGGIHATVMAEEAAELVDTLFTGEAENTWPEFIRDFCRGQPQKLYSQSGYPPVEMNKIPLPRYDLVARYKYPVVWLQTTRGCPHDCEFCAASRIYGRKYRHKEVEQVISEIREVKKYWKFAMICFADDNMFVNRKFSTELVSEFKKTNFTWYAQSDISVAEDQPFLRSLYESGCRMLFIGFESASQSNMKSINKNHWKEQMFSKYPEYIQRIQENGIGIYGSFILGFDQDDSSAIERTISFISDNPIMGAQLTILTPFPGSRLRERLEKEKRIIHNDWQWYTAWNAVINHKNFTPDELERGLIRIYKSIYNEHNQKSRAAYFRKICEKLVNQ